jgi:hypothetical protein
MFLTPLGTFEDSEPFKAGRALNSSKMQQVAGVCLPCALPPFFGGWRRFQSGFRSECRPVSLAPWPLVTPLGRGAWGLRFAGGERALDNPSSLTDSVDFVEPPYEAPEDGEPSTDENPDHEHQPLGKFIPVAFVVVFELGSCV